MKKLGIIMIFGLLIFQNSNSEELSHFATKCHTHSHLKHKDRLQSMMQCSYISPSGVFRINYDTTGFNAVDITDKDKNGIPDYVDSVAKVFDYVYDVEVVQMNMLKPLSSSHHSYYDIDIEELGVDENACYGYTSPQEAIGDGRYYSCITIDNNYSPQDGFMYNGKWVTTYKQTNGINALKVTAAHEFNHSIQFMYYSDPANTSSIYEMSAVSLEMLLFPDIHDYAQYVNSLLADLTKYNFGDGNANNGYCYGLWFYMLCNKYGDDIIKRYWEIVAAKNNCYRAFDTLLNEKESSFKQEWREFIHWLYYMGDNAVEGKYFEYASELNTPIPNKNFDIQTVDGNMLTPLEFSFSHYIKPNSSVDTLPATLDVIFTNHNLEGAARRSLGYNYSAEQISANIAFQFLDSATEYLPDFYLRILASPDCEAVIFANSGGKIENIETAFPSPFSIAKNNELYFPINKSADAGDRIQLIIYDITYKEVTHIKLDAMVKNNKKVVKYQPDLKPGVYVFSTGRAVTEVIGKFAIVE